MCNYVRMRVPEEDAEELRLYASFLKSKRESICGPNEEERNKKKKNQKEINKKEEKKKKNNAQAQEIFSENIPLIDAIREYYQTMVDPMFDADEFIDICIGNDWLTSKGKPITLRNYKSYMRGLTRYKKKEKEEKEEQMRQKAEELKLKQEQYAKRKSKSDNASANGRDGGSESGKPQGGAGAGTAGGAAEPVLSRRELVEKLLAEQYPVDEGKSKELERVLAGAVECAKGAGGGTGTDLAGGVSLDHLAARYGANEVTCWLARAILERAEHLGENSRNYVGDRIVKDARSFVMNAHIYHGRQTARLFLDVLNSIDEIGTSTLGKAIYNKTRNK